MQRDYRRNASTPTTFSSSSKCRLILTDSNSRKGVSERLHNLLDRQDRGEALTPAERTEAEGLVELSELLSLLRLRTQRIW